MRKRPFSGKLFFAALAIAFATGPAACASFAVFEFEIVRGQDIGFSDEYLAEEAKRLQASSDQLRKRLSDAGLQVADISSVAERAARQNLQACGNCADDLAAELGADYAVTGQVTRISTLILGMQIFIRRVEEGRPVFNARVDLRGNTDESWRRAVDYLFKNRLAPVLRQLPVD
jgi:hypothetical protein